MTINSPSLTRRVLIVLAILVLHACVLADDPAQVSLEPDDRVAATVDGKPIYVRQVLQQIKQVFKDRAIDPQAKPYIEAQTLEQLVKRRLILTYLEANGAAASDQELNLAIGRIQEQLATQDLTLKKHLEKIGLTEDDFRHALRWQIGWQQYLDRYLIDENLQRYFKQHHQDFDGTQLRVSQILIRVEPTVDTSGWQRALEKAMALRAEVASGKISFAEAARQHSQSPSAKNGGDIGLISRNQPMPESFSRTAFELKRGEISQPVRSKFGVHLIQCVDVKPGDKQWTDVKRELSLAVTRYLFDWVSDQQRGNAKIEYAQDVPHFRDGTTELAD